MFKHGSKITCWLNFAHNNTKLQWQIVGELIQDVELYYILYCLHVMENKHAKSQSYSANSFRFIGI